MGAQEPRRLCFSEIADQAVPVNCLQASSSPQLGALYPLTHDLFVSPQGQVGVGTLSPGEQLTVNGRIHSLSGGVRFPDGTVQQTAAGAGFDGSIKAAVHFNGGQIRYESSIGAGLVTISPSGNDAHVLDFGSSVEDNFFVATAAFINGPTDLNLAVDVGVDNDPSQVLVRQSSDGFYLLVY